MALQEKDGRYYRVCDDCGNVMEIKRQYYMRLKKSNNINLCGGCCQSGERNHRFGKKPWNYGLTAEEDKRVAAYTENMSKSKTGSVPWNKGKTYEQLKGSEWACSFKNKMSESRKGKPNYKKRGITTEYAKSFGNIRKLIRARIYEYWSKPIMQRDGFICTRCCSKLELEVHHIKPMRIIITESAKQLNLDLSLWNRFSGEQIESLCNTVLKNHELDMGITLCKVCHKEVDRFRRKFDDNKKND